MVNTDVVVETRGGLTYYSIMDAGRSAPILKLVEPVKVNWKWNVQDGYTRVVTSINSSVVDGLGVTHDGCVRIELQDRNKKTVNGSTEFYVKGIGLVNEHFVAYKLPEEQK